MVFNEYFSFEIASLSEYVLRKKKLLLIFTWTELGLNNHAILFEVFSILVFQLSFLSKTGD